MTVVVVSAKGLPGDMETAVKAGANVYPAKPVSYSDLKQAMDKVLE